MNKTDYKVEGYLIRARAVFSDYARNVSGYETNPSNIKTKTIIDIAQMIQREENPPVYVLGNQIQNTGIKTYMYVVDDDGEQQAEVQAPDFEAAIPLMQKRLQEQFGADVSATLLRAGMTRLED